MPAAEALRERDPLGRHVNIHASADSDAVAADQNSTVELRQIFDLFAHAAITQITLFGTIALEWIEVNRPAHRQYLLGVTDYEQRSDGLRFAAFPADLGR